MSDSVHPFDEWFSRVYQQPQPPGVRETAIIAWNAGVHAAAAYADQLKERLLDKRAYELAALARDIRDDLKTNVTRRNV